jgi:hypothetical protein
MSAPIVLAKDTATRSTRTPCSILDELFSLLKQSSSSSSSSSSASSSSPRSSVLIRSQGFQLLQMLYLPQPVVAENNPSSRAPFSWVKAICELEEVDDVLDHTVVALCTAQIYVTQSGNVSHEQAIEQYNTALRMLSATLIYEVVSNLDYILASIVVLSTCEVGIPFGLSCQLLSIRCSSSYVPRTTVGELIFKALRTCYD